MAKIDYWENGELIQIDESDSRNPANEEQDLDADALQSQLKAEELRGTRNSELLATDWTQLSDVPDTIKNKYTTYRQQLRDLPATDGFPDVDMPTKPS
tara:strand:- start:1294 stop:1587 length:294 start_codon:yes stop_codon:yes gene_type:complete